MKTTPEKLPLRYIKMPMTNAERQRKYRENLQKNGENTRINAIVTPTTIAALERMCLHYGVTQKLMIEQLVAGAEISLMETFTPAQQREYETAVEKKR